MQPKIKILLVDDHPLVREWLTNLLNEEPDFEVCGSAGNTREALGLIGTLLPRIVVVDISLDGGFGPGTYQGRQSGPSQSGHDCLVHARRDALCRTGDAGRAAGYVMKREATDKVLEAIRAVLQGSHYFSNAVNAMLAQKLVQGTGDQPTAIAALSDRELEVFQLLGRGYSTRQISEQMNVGFKTVHAYCARIREKLNLANIHELVFHAVRWHESQQPR